jgi:hypothetical protein
MDSNEHKLLCKEEVFQIVGCAMEVLNALGHGRADPEFQKTETRMGAIGFMTSFESPTGRGIHSWFYSPSYYAGGRDVVPGFLAQGATKPKFESRFPKSRAARDSRHDKKMRISTTEIGTP